MLLMMSGIQNFSFGAIILAAGSSSRMGRPKMLLPWKNTTILGHLLSVWKNLAASQIAVVHSGSDTAVAAELDRLRFPSSHRIANPNPARGMFSSVQCAAQWDGWNENLTHWAIALGDQPHLQPETLEALLSAAKTIPNKIHQPAWKGTARHPVLLPRDIFKQLRVSPGENLKMFLHHFSSSSVLIERNDPGLGLDIDHPDDYEKALALYRES
jgi:molybdenum cofactor cytidylyltransferase